MRYQRTIGIPALLAIVACLAATLALGQMRSQRVQAQLGGPGGRFRDAYRQPNRGARRRRVRSPYPRWEIDPEFRNDVFTFVRIQYTADGPFGWWDRWDNDYPDSDLNFSFRLHQLTALCVDPDNRVLRLTHPDLFDYPFIYMAGVQRMVLSRREQTVLRRYLLNGGFVMMDDFWASEGWDNVLSQMRGVFPDRAPEELSIDHDIFHTVFDLHELPQVVDIRTWREGYKFEYRHAPSDGDEAPHFWAYFDDHERMVALLCHNNDLGDGWEREGENEAYFHQFSEKYSYPMGINILMYVMTH